MTNTQLPLVSIIIPCYNGERLIGRALESVIAQTYRPVEVVIVNDGSTDGSEELILSYREKMEQARLTLVYHYQENKGLGGAVDTALKLFSGQYFCLADYDDFLAPTSIEKRVMFLQSHPEYAVVTSDAYKVYEDDPLTPIGKVSGGVTDNENEHQFWNLLQANSIFCAGSHLFRTEDFLAANPTRSIYPARRGQNWQLLLPVYHRFKRFFLNEPLYYYVVRRDSMSKDHSLQDRLVRFDEHQDIITKTLESMEMEEADREKAITITKTNYARRKLTVYAESGQQKQANDEYQKLKSLGKVTVKDWIMKHPGLYKTLKKLRKIVRDH